MNSLAPSLAYVQRWTIVTESWSSRVGTGKTILGALTTSSSTILCSFPIRVTWERKRPSYLVSKNTSNNWSWLLESNGENLGIIYLMHIELLLWNEYQSYLTDANLSPWTVQVVHMTSWAGDDLIVNVKVLHLTAGHQARNSTARLPSALCIFCWNG